MAWFPQKAPNKDQLTLNLDIWILTLLAFPQIEDAVMAISATLELLIPSAELAWPRFAGISAMESLIDLPRRF